MIVGSNKIEFPQLIHQSSEISTMIAIMPIYMDMALIKGLGCISPCFNMTLYY